MFLEIHATVTKGIQKQGSAAAILAGISTCLHVCYEVGCNSVVMVKLHILDDSKTGRTIKAISFSGESWSYSTLFLTLVDRLISVSYMIDF